MIKVKKTKTVYSTIFNNILLPSLPPYFSRARYMIYDSYDHTTDYSPNHSDSRHRARIVDAFSIRNLPRAREIQRLELKTLKASFSLLCLLWTRFYSCFKASTGFSVAALHAGPAPASMLTKIAKRVTDIQRGKLTLTGKPT